VSTGLHFVQIPDTLIPILGEADPGTRIFRQVGSKEDNGRWFDAICEHIGTTVSPGGVSMYAKVSRAAVYKRIKEGRLTAFCFHEIEERSKFFGGTKTVRTSPFIYVPVEEAKAWGAEIEARLKRGEKLYREEMEGDKPDFKGEFFDWDSSWRKKQLAQFRSKPLRGGA
jgi:hypothetical protein